MALFGGKGLVSPIIDRVRRVFGQDTPQPSYGNRNLPAGSRGRRRKDRTADNARIMAIAAQRRLRQEQLAKLAGVSPTAYSLTRHDRPPGMDRKREECLDAQMANGHQPAWRSLEEKAFMTHAAPD